MKKEAPVGATKALKNSIGRRFERGKKGSTVKAKAGVNVGKRTEKKVGREAPHSHLIALGTKQRTRKTIGGRYGFIKNPTDAQLSTGTGPQNSYIRRAVEGSTGSVRQAMHKRAAAKLITEAKAAKK
jgi:hypothetical protein